MADINHEIIFKQWLCEYDKLIFKIVRSYAQSPSMREDLFQDILLQLWCSIPNFRGDAKPSTWIYKVALNTALVWKRTETRKNKRDKTAVMNFIETNNIKNSSESSENENILNHVYDAIGKLPKIDSSVILNASGWFKLRRNGRCAGNLGK